MKIHLFQMHKFFINVLKQVMIKHLVVCRNVQIKSNWERVTFQLKSRLLPRHVHTGRYSDRSVKIDFSSPSEPTPVLKCSTFAKLQTDATQVPANNLPRPISKRRFQNMRESLEGVLFQRWVQRARRISPNQMGSAAFPSGRKTPACSSSSPTP